MFNFGGKDNTYEERTLDEPPHADNLKLVQAVGAALDQVEQAIAEAAAQIGPMEDP